MRNFDLPYTDYLNQGRAWSPTWTGIRRGFDCWLVLAPPAVDSLESAADYLALLSRRLEHQIEIWLDQYSDELPFNVDRNDPEAIWAATLEMIQQDFPVEASPDQTVRTVAERLAQATLPPLADVQFPVQLAELDPNEDFGLCLDETTLKGWLIEAR